MQRNKLLLLLVLLMTAATGAWADGVTMKEITSSDIQSSWNGNTDPVKATDLPGFKAMTHDEAIALGAPSNDEKVYLIYAINASNKFAALIYEYGTKSSYETEFNLKELQSSAQNYWVYYTYSDAPAGYTVSLKDGVKDADKWTVKVGEGQAQALPIDGLTGLSEGDKVTLQYNGRLKVKGVKATSDAVPATVSVTAITLNKTATTITAGQTETLSVSSVTPDDATDQTVTWSSDNEAVATVDADGKVTAVALGTANITATANDGSGVTATCAVTVSKVVTINQSDWGGARSSFTKDGVTVSAGFIDSRDGNLMDDGTFSTTLGNFTKIVVTTQAYEASGTGWSGGTWAGTPASTVSFSGDFMGMGMTQTTIVCTIVPTN